MSPRTDHVVLALESGIRVVQQALFQSYRAPLQEAGLSLHFAAFAAVCLGVQHASDHEMEVVDVHARVEKALRYLCSAWDARPPARRRLSIAAVLRSFGDVPVEAPRLQDARALALAVPGVPEPEPGDRADYVLARYHRYADGVYIFSCDPTSPNTWDEGGADSALERALFRDVYCPADAPRVDPARTVFGAVLAHFRTWEAPAGDGAP
jgi:hypothetical protein